MEKKANSANDFDLLPWLQHVYGDLQFSRTSLQLDQNNNYTIDYADIKNEILGTNNFPNILPRYFEKIASMFPNAMIYKKSKIKFYGQKARITKSMSLAETMIKHHQSRIKQL